VLLSLTRALPLVAWIAEVAFGDYSERSDRRERSALGTIDFVHSFAVADQLTSVSTWEVEVLRKHVVRLAVASSVGRTATAATASIARIAPLSTVG
jgi:hypothetical protein